MARGRPRAGPRWQGFHRAGKLRGAMKKATKLGHRNRKKSVRHRAKLKAKTRRVRLRRSRGESKNT